jgi:molybdopterin/thiamine biosynthesis adenylyltransferase
VAEDALLGIHDALRQRGFVRQFETRMSHLYKGPLDPNGFNLPGWIEFRDVDFVDLPLIGIDPAYPDLDRKLPHVLGLRRAICYYARGSVVLDRYNPAGTVIQCLERAERVMADAMSGRSDGDFAAEFGAYWRDFWMMVDLPDGYTGPAYVDYVELTRGAKRSPVVNCGKSWVTAQDCRPPRRRPAGANAWSIACDHPITLDPNGSWPPTNLAEFNTWLRFTAPKLVGELERSMVTGEGHVGMIVIQAPNGTFGCRIQVPPMYRTEEFLTNRRKSLPKLLQRYASDVGIERISLDKASVDYIYGRNMGSRKNLIGKRILLIGCGTIGSFLAQQLAQSGAGVGAGCFTLVDLEKLSTANLGRHLLGVPYVDRNKAEACAEFLNQQLPGMAIDAHACDVRKLPKSLDKYDLVVDATGEEGLSLALNQLAVDRRPTTAPHLFVWLLGNGAMAQCLLTGEPDKACLKCLKPELSAEPRFRGLRPGITVELGTGHACSDPQFIPFPVSRSVAAAALACDQVLDWANGTLGHRFRSLRIDQDLAFDIAWNSPAPSEVCPACRRLACS